MLYEVITQIAHDGHAALHGLPAHALDAGVQGVVARLHDEPVALQHLGHQLDAHAPPADVRPAAAVLEEGVVGRA